MSETKVATCQVDDRAAKRVKMGYPWIFRSEMTRRPAAADGDVVEVQNKAGHFVARAIYNSQPQLSLRVLTRETDAVIDAGFIEAAINRAIMWRQSLYDGTPFYRVIHAESDGLPGLIIDRYDDVVVAQVNTAGMQKLWPHIQSALIDAINPQAIILRNDSSAREMEGLPQEVAVAYGTTPEGSVSITENGVTFMVDVQDGQKTGWFFDQRDNRAHVAALSAGKTVADIFCHTGAFGLTALVRGGAAGCTFIDASEKALADAAANAQVNGVADKCSYIAGRAFDEMERLVESGKRFDVVCVDPPAFIKSRKDMATGMKGYQKLARLAAKLTAPGGVMFFASCSHHADTKELLETVADGIARTGRSAQLVRTGGAGLDHPVHPQLPETAYLKSFTFRFLD